MSKTSDCQLIKPYGGTLVDLFVSAEEHDPTLEYAKSLPSIQLTRRSYRDLEMLAMGAFSPLDRFMGAADLTSVVNDMRLANGYLFPLPIVLTVDEEDGIEIGMTIALRDINNDVAAVMTVEEKYRWDIEEIARKVYGRFDLRHPMVAQMHRWGPYLISGPIQVIQLAAYYDFPESRLTPPQTRAHLSRIGSSDVVAYHTRNPLNQLHNEVVQHAAEHVNGSVLLQPIVGNVKPGSTYYSERIQAYKQIASDCQNDANVLLSMIPLVARDSGPRDALLQAIVRRNYGANHMVIGRNHASPGKDANGNLFYPPFAAQKLLIKHSAELGVNVVPFSDLVDKPGASAPGVPNGNLSGSIDRSVKVVPVRSEHPKGSLGAFLTGGVHEDYVKQQSKLPAWFTRPDVAETLSNATPMRFNEGICIWLTGLSGTGKTPTAARLTALLQAHGRIVTLLDANEVRSHLSGELGFDKADRDENVRRIGFVAAEVVRHGGVAVCAAESPYRSTRNEIRNMVGRNRFVQVFMDCDVDTLAARDTKGLYALARTGELRDFSGVTSPYEAPDHPDVHIEAACGNSELWADQIFALLKQRGYVTR